VDSVGEMGAQLLLLGYSFTRYWKLRKRDVFDSRDGDDDDDDRAD
jgi:hypothetical protein